MINVQMKSIFTR